jgi:hypothetical protein
VTATTDAPVSKPLVFVPVGASPAWLAAAEAAEGQCTCTGACGRSHAKKPAKRCDRTLTGRYRLYLTGDGQLWCEECLGAAAAQQRKSVREQAPAPEAPGLFDLSEVTGGVT